jgi:hypothetical protein
LRRVSIVKAVISADLDPLEAANEAAFRSPRPEPAGTASERKKSGFARLFAELPSSAQALSAGRWKLRHRAHQRVLEQGVNL